MLRNYSSLKLFLTLAFVGVSSVARAAQPLTAPKSLRPISWADQPVQCATLVAQFQELKEKINEQNLMFAGYADGAYVVVDRLHKEYQGLEGKSAEIKPGQFNGLGALAQEMNETKESIYTTLEVLNQRFDQFTEILPNCLK